MTDAEILQHLKSRKNFTGNWQDDSLLGYIADAKQYCIDAGVPQEVLDSDVSVGVICRGAMDLWSEYAAFSDYFFQRVAQLRYKTLPPTLGSLTVSSSAGDTVGTTAITVTGQSENAILRYQLSVGSIDLPAYNEDLSDWTAWDGVSDIVAEDGHKICVCEVSSEILAQKAGQTTVRVNLG